MSISTDTIIGHYRIISKIGAGGMGEVWLAEDTRLDRKVALKLLLPAEFTQDAGRLRRFTQEAKAASALNHPNIISVYDIGECETGRFIWTDIVLSAAYAQLGEQALARGALKNLIAQNSAESVRELLTKWFDAELVEHLVEGLRKAGLEIAADPDLMHGVKERWKTLGENLPASTPTVRRGFASG